MQIYKLPKASLCSLYSDPISLGPLEPQIVVDWAYFVSFPRALRENAVT